MSSGHEDFYRALEAIGGVRLNDEQRLAVDSDLNTVVSAGAGSGKTTVLSIRFLRLVMEGRAKADGILTLTFTRKAAMEMRERIRALLTRALPCDDENRQLVNKATIATLDSFTSSIVRLDSTHYGIPRDFTLEEERERKERLSRLASAFLEDRANAAIVEALSSCYSPASIVDDFFRVIDENVVPCGDYDAASTSAWLREDLSARFKAMGEELGVLLGHIALDSSREKIRETAGQLCAMLEEGLSFPDPTFSSQVRLRAHKDDPVNDDIKALKELSARYISLGEALAAGDDDNLLQQAIERFAAILNAEKRRSGRLSYNDVNALALDILKRNLALREHFKGLFSHVMIDEFQDNNSLQRDLLYLICEKKGQGEEGRVPTIHELEGDKLFLVGDEKQSIYLFRGADVSVFRAMKDEIASAGGNALSLSTNYRSAPGLIRHFNDVFRKVFADAREDYEASFEETRCGKAAGEGSVTLLSGCKADFEGRDDDLAADEREAAALASLVERMLTGDDYLVDGERPKCDDIAILFPRLGHVVAFEIALKARGIDYQMSEARSLMQQAVSGDFYSILQHYLFPEDRIAWCATLRSPFVGLSDKAILTLEEGGRQALDEVDRRRLEALDELMEGMDRLAFVSLSRLLSYLFYEGGYYAHLQRRADWQGFEEHFDYLLAYAMAYDKASLKLTDFLSFLRDRLGDRQRLDDVTVLDEERHGVQLMTVHSSKGLEFPIVILASCGTKGRNDQKSFIFRHCGRLVATSSKGLGQVLDGERKARSDAETKRLLYVAMTRAESHLVVSGVYEMDREDRLSGNTGLFFRLYLEATWDLDGIRRLEIGAEEPVPGRDRTSLLSRLLSTQEEERDFTSRPLVAKPSGSVEEPEGPVVDLPSMPADGLYTDGGEAGAFGSAVHAYLEASIKGGDREAVFRDRLFSGRDGALVRADLTRMADNFLSSGLYARLKAHRLLSEYHLFSYDEEKDFVWEAVVDLVADLGDAALVVDYKSDRQTWRGRHRTQVVTYCKALEKLLGKPCYGTIFNLRRTECEVLWNARGEEVDWSRLPL